MSGASSTSTSGPLLIEISPHSSSFFAGESFICTLSFINTLPAPPPPLSSPQTTPIPTSGAYFPRFAAGKGHAKSHSVDVQTFARDLALEKKDERAQDARWYAAQREREREETLALQQQAGSAPAPSKPSFALHRASESVGRVPSAAELREEQEAMPRRRGLVGRQRTPAASGTSTPVHPAPSAAAAAVGGKAMGHRASQSLYATAARSGLGIGHPAGEASSSAAFRTPLPSGAGVAHTPLDLRAASGSSALSASSAAATRTASAPAPAPAPQRSAPARLPSARVPAAHPHARKESVAAIQAEDLSSAFALDPDPETQSPASSGASTPRFPHPATQPASSVGAGERGFYAAGEAANDTLESVLRDDITSWSAARPSSNLSSPSSAPAHSPLFPPSSRAPPADGSVRLLWAYAQFGGEFRLDESLIKPGEFEDMKRRLLLSSSASAFGASSLFAPRSLTSAAPLGVEPKRRSSWGSYLSPTAWRHRRQNSTMEETKRKLGESRTTPLFVTQPSVLLVDEDLGPGERRSCECLYAEGALRRREWRGSERMP